MPTVPSLAGLIASLNEQVPRMAAMRWRTMRAPEIPPEILRTIRGAGGDDYANALQWSYARGLSLNYVGAERLRRILLSIVGKNHDGFYAALGETLT